MIYVWNMKEVNGLLFGQMIFLPNTSGKCTQNHGVSNKTLQVFPEIAVLSGLIDTTHNRKYKSN